MSIKPNQVFIRNIPTTSARVQTNRLGLTEPASGMNDYLQARREKPRSELMRRRKQNVPRFPNSSTQFSYGQANIWMNKNAKMRIPYPIPGNASDARRSLQRVAVGGQIIKREIKARGNRLY